MTRFSKFLLQVSPRTTPVSLSPQVTTPTPEFRDLYVGFCKEPPDSAVNWILILYLKGHSYGTWWHTLPTHDNDYELRKENSKSINHPSIVSKQWVANIPVSELAHVEHMMLHDIPMQHSQRWVIAVLVALERFKGLLGPFVVKDIIVISYCISVLNELPVVYLSYAQVEVETSFGFDPTHHQDQLKRTPNP
ncbi:Ornithine carbamoyltransferase [Penicillium atrosanguineum]|uniref:Uncharacterized protein n=1 Tax=Penicillium atrosanguineum TaxID=1132637 RepID=A0A9W9Q475_9EURO|nr:Ornithine carbamoyltransferase [Penicillium atrosanguineum]KAJ5304832.1 Ornithine carbamoyltransferase [Penicillium atrosanguineum]KAJ5324296.1 hypothetical protein N7476_002896 [Penicillium atrosanguineum]